MKIFDEKQFEDVNVFGKGQPNDAYAKYFTGNSFFESAHRPRRVSDIYGQRDV